MLLSNDGLLTGVNGFAVFSFTPPPPPLAPEPGTIVLFTVAIGAMIA